jgi:SWI/SNF-related matrix-associated actin-dependent regulator of chromatin subfamily A member 5
VLAIQFANMAPDTLSTVVGNWIREFNKWCPIIKAVRMGGTKDERQLFIKNDLPIDPATGKYTFDVLVTSYEGLLKEKGRFSRIEWKYLVIDEAHRIKNEKSSLSLAVRIMKPQFRLLITGTPLQVTGLRAAPMPCTRRFF